ncbi:hypothetical protein [Kitasatospora sp. NPDC057936]|uniref:hypothetical protein n=1 Tax=Kitasatospora sp. NPDC057936 TaxID=3346283 RepID=UPI0036DDF846
MFSHRLARIAVLCALLAAGVTACASQNAVEKADAPAQLGSTGPGGLDVDTLSADQIVDQAKAVMASVTSVHVVGDVVTDGDRITADLSADSSKNCTGTVSMGSIGTVQVIHTGAGTWMKPDDTYWASIAGKEGGGPQSGAKIAELFKGRYLVIGQGNADLKQLTAMCDLVGAIAGDKSKSIGATKGGSVTVNGVKTLSITLPDDSAPTNLYIATEGKPYLIRMESGGKEASHYNFSDFDKPLPVQAPPVDQVIDFSVFAQEVKSASA